MRYDEIVYANEISRIFNYKCLLAKKIIELFPIPSTFFELNKKELSALFPNNPGIIDCITNTRLLQTCAEEIDWCKEHGVLPVFIGDREYPARLRECPDAPILIFYRGNADLNHSRIISIVGTRKATSYGMGQCKEIVRHLAKLTPAPIIISGLAYGIDITAHKAALDVGIDTIGVIPTGMDSIYPAQHRNYAAQMVKQGGILTDFHRNTTPFAINFLQRNRIIAGMSDAVVLIESDIKGGGMITARTASSYSIDVFAVPGRNTDRFSSGCNSLIERNEASIITSPENLCAAIGWTDKKSIKSKENENFSKFLAEKNPLIANILLALSDNSELDHDTLIDKVGADPTEVLSALTELELDGVIETDLYGRYTLIKS